MDDPWSSGPSWSTPVKPPRLGTDADLRTFTPSPPPNLDVSDPWGINPAAATPAVEQIMTIPAPRKQSLSTAWEQDGWGGGGGDTEPKIIPETASTAEPAPSVEMDRPNWDLNSPAPASTALPDDVLASDTVKTPDVTSDDQATAPTTPTEEVPPINAIPSAQSPPSPPYQSPSHLNHPRAPVIDDPPEGFSGPGRSSLPQSPTFGDFGGFSGGFGDMDLQPNFGESSGFGGGSTSGNGISGFGDTEEVDENSVDPWGNGAGGSWGVVEDRLPTSLAAPTIDDEDDDGDEDGWGGSRGGVPARNEKNAAEEDWEEAQRRIRLRQERAPTERVRALQEDWRKVALSQVGLDKLEPLTEEEERTLEEGIRKMNELSEETLSSLSTIPPAINTYPPVISSLTTHELHTYALARPNPTPSTSLLQLPPTRRLRATESFDSAPAPWLSRSKLGEPDAPVAEIATSPQDATASRSRWSLWGRKASEKQLVTSGGGILEVKALVPTPSPGPGISDLNGSTSSAPSMTSISTKQSRPASPATLPSIPQFPTSTSIDLTETHQTSPSAAAPGPAPVESSAVSRFFSRLSRKPSQPTTHDNDNDPHDLELSADDFSYLQEVPSISHPRQPERGIGDLLSMESGRSEEIASLESMLSAKPAALPSPLAPPPKGRGPVARMVSSGGISDTPAGRMKAAAAARGGAGDMDLLGGLDFGSDASKPSNSSGVSANTNGVASSSSTFSAWDDFMAPTPPAKRDSTPPILPQPKSTTIKPVSSTCSAASPGMTASSSNNHTPPSLGPPPKDDFTFDDFGTPRQADTSSFDDFGDFGTFNQSSSSSNSNSTFSQATASFPTPNKTPHHQQSSTPLRPAQGQLHSFTTPAPRKLSTTLDHTPTLNLLNDASATKGRRWPAPPSPVAPVLEPPPPPSTGSVKLGSGGFPFLSPPPPAPGVRSRPGSRLANPGAGGGDLLGGGLGDDGDDKKVNGGQQAMGDLDIMSLGGPVNPTATTNQGVQRSSTPIMPGLQAPPMGNSKTGLSAQDLSFFDSL